MSEFLNSLHQVNKNWEPYKKWEQEQDDKEFQRQQLHKSVQTSKEDLEKADQYGHTIVDAINIMDQYSINKAEDVEAMVKPIAGQLPMVGLAAGAGLGALMLKIPGLSKFTNKSSRAQGLTIGIPATLGFIGSIIYGTIKFKAYEKEASRVARYQAREQELQDPKNFVIYNKDQIEKGKELAKTMPDVPDKNKNRDSLNPITNIINSIKSIKSVVKDHDKYLKWKESYIKSEQEKKESFKTMNASPEQIQKAKKDRDNLLNVIKKIEIYSQNYLCNVEMAVNSMIACDFVGGIIGGGILSGAVALAQKMKILTKDSPKATMIKKLSPIIAPALLVVLTSVYAIKAQKEAARIGRFKAKQELLSNPNNFISYDDKNNELVKDLKAPKKSEKGFFGKLKDDAKFFVQLVKDYKEYEKYQKTQGKDETKLREALKKIEISPEQMDEAKSLQKKAFITFEKMDEKTQRYSDDVDGAADIIKTFAAISTVLIGEGLSTFLIIRALRKGKDTGSIAFLPMILSTLVNVPLEIKGIQIRKQAAKIGLMEAMQDLDDPKNFVDKDSTAQSQNNNQQTTSQQTDKKQNPMQTWLEKIQKQRTQAA